MFGYIRPCRPELKIKDEARFRAYYCGICKALGRRSGPLCRALLRYDLAFLALVRDGVMDDTQMQVLRCPVKGTKLNMMQGASIDFCADAHPAPLRGKGAGRPRGRQGLRRAARAAAAPAAAARLRALSRPGPGPGGALCRPGRAGTGGLRRPGRCGRALFGVPREALRLWHARGGPALPALYGLQHRQVDLLARRPGRLRSRRKEKRLQRLAPGGIQPQAGLRVGAPPG